jgi:hypothetical protein
MDFSTLDFNVDWKKEEASLETGEGVFTFVNKHEKLVIKLMFQPHIDGDWKEEFITYFEGQEKPVKQYLVKGVIINTAERTQTPTVLVLKPSHIGQIITVAKGLLEEEEVNILHPSSNPLAFTKVGTGMNTKYSVNPLTKQVDCGKYLDQWDKSLKEYKEELTKPKKNTPKEEKLTEEEEKDLFED